MTWIHIPDTSITSRSAPAAADSMSVSNWQFHVLAAFCWRRGKPLHARHWLRLCKRASWLKLLYGAMSEPSTADHGVVSWMASLAGSRVSPIPSPVASAENSTIATSGRRPAASSRKAGPGTSSSRTSAACSRRGMTKSLERSEFTETFASWAMRLREDCLRRKKRARRISASASSSLAWQTPISADSGEKATQASHQNSLSKQGKNWSTPDAGVFGDGHDPEAFLERREKVKAKGINGNGMGTPLAVQASGTWPTMRTGLGATSQLPADPKLGTSRIEDAAGMWPTATASRGGDNTNSAAVKERGHGNNLIGVVQQWPAPRARDGKGAPDELRLENSRPLNEVAKVWSTPRVSADRTSPNAMDRQDSMAALSIGQQAEIAIGEVPREIYLLGERAQRRLGFDPSSLPAPMTETDGATSSPEPRSLNPLFVEWLMGWPSGWTLLALTDSACSATEWSLYKQQMRFALWSIDLPPEAPPAQLSLFG
jgi:hypothetical protein